MKSQVSDSEYQSKKKAAERWLRWWAREAEKGYELLGYKPFSPEQANAGGGGRAATADPLPIEVRMVGVMNYLKRTEPDLYTVGTLEYRKQGEFFARCNVNHGWRDLTTNIFHPVKTVEMRDDEGRRAVVGKAGRRDFMKYVSAHYGVKSSQYYNLVKRLKHRVIDWVL